MAEYKVARVSDEEPREHFNEQYKTTTYYIKVMLEGHARPVTIGKKSRDALKIGDTVNGTILPTEYDTDNFKSEFNKAGSPGQAFTPKDTAEIKAQWAIGQAVATEYNLYGIEFEKTGKASFGVDSIESRARQYFAMVDRVKDNNLVSRSVGTPVVSGYAQAKEAADKLRQTTTAATPGHETFADGSPVFDPFHDEPINLNDIPF